MSRPLRIHYQNAIYHVMNRGRHRERTFWGQVYHDLFYKTLEEAHERFDLQVLAFCLMPNHYHLLLKTPKANISRCMRHIDGVYTQRVNKRRQTDGSLFRGRYKSILVQKDEYLLPVSRYIHRNPIAGKMPLVENLDEYKASSYNTYITGEQTLKCLYPQEVLDLFHNTRASQAYKSYVENHHEQETLEKFYQQTRLPAILGDDLFKAKCLKYDKNSTREISLAADQPYLSVDTVITCVAKHFQLSTHQIKSPPKRNKKSMDARGFAMRLCRDKTNATLQHIADNFGLGHYTTVSKAISRIETILEKNHDLESFYNVIFQDLTPSRF